MGKDKDHVLLNLSHLDKKVITERLPGISDAARLFADVDVTKRIQYQLFQLFTIIWVVFQQIIKLKC